MRDITDKGIIECIKNNGIGVIPTDTMYGVIGSALSKKAVERIYKVRSRDSMKPFIVLIGSLEDLPKVGVRLDAKIRPMLKKFWPGSVSIILPCSVKIFFYLHRGTQTLAIRFPKKKSLLELLKKTGPLVAPSANPESMPPATTITDAKGYFGDMVDFYVSEGKQESLPSTLIRIADGKVVVLRVGAVEISQLDTLEL